MKHHPPKKKQWRLHNCGNTTEATTLLQQFIKKKTNKTNMRLIGLLLRGKTCEKLESKNGRVSSPPPLPSSPFFEILVRCICGVAELENSPPPRTGLIILSLNRSCSRDDERKNGVEGISDI